MDAEFSEREFQARKAALLEECELAPQVFENVSPRLVQFMEPFVDSLVRKEQVGHALTFVRGLLSDLDHRNVESIAYRFGQERLPLQWFIGVSKWDDQPLREDAAADSGRHLADPASRVQMRFAVTHRTRTRGSLETQRVGPPVPLGAA